MYTHLSNVQSIDFVISRLIIIGGVFLPVEGGVTDACARVDWSASGCLGARTGAPLLAHDIIPGGEAGLLVWQLRALALLHQPPVAPSHLLGGELLF